jgi:hypothetical protein
MPTQAMTDLSDVFRKYANALNDYADRQSNPLDPSLAQVRTTAAHLSVDAAIIAQKQLNALTQAAEDAISGLQAQVKVAQTALDTLTDIKAAVSIGAAVLAAAAAIASGNFTGAVAQVVALGSTIASTLRGVGTT